MFRELTAHESNLSEFKQATDLLNLNFKGPKEYGPDDIVCMLQRELYRLFVLIMLDSDTGDPVVAGTAFVAIYSSKQAMHLEYLAIHSRFQGLGLGKMVINMLIEYGRSIGSEESIQADANDDSTVGRESGDQDKPDQVSTSDGSSKSDLRIAIMTLECTKDLTNFYVRLGAKDSGLTQTWQIDYGTGELVTKTHHFLYYVLHYDLLQSIVCEHSPPLNPIAPIRQSLEEHHQMAEILIKDSSSSVQAK